MLMFAPYVRLVALHMTIILGAMLSISMGSPVGSMIVLVAIKIAIDLAFHIREHRKARAGAAA
jgi:fructose-specific phosphotransferase system IIC component